MILITLSDILNFVGESMRPLKEGYLIANSSHILRCGLTTRAEPLFEVFALVFQNSDLKDKPVEVTIKIVRNYQDDELDIKTHCTCKAASENANTL